MQHFVASLAQKLAFSTDDFDKAPAVASAVHSPESDQTASQPAAQAVPVIASGSTDVSPATIKTPTVRTAGASSKTRKPAAAPVDDEADAEEVALTLTKPVEERVGLLKDIP